MSIRTVTLTQLIQRIRKRSDIISATGHWGDSDITDLINERYFNLYDLLVSAYSNYYAKTAPNQTLTAGVNTYDLPNDFYKLISMDRDNGNGTKTSIFPYLELERNSSLYSSSNQIPTGALVSIRYIPQPVALVIGSDTIDGVSGWESILIDECAAVMKDSEESDTSKLERSIEKEKKRIEQMAATRDVTMPARVTDVSVYDNAYIRDALRYHLFGNKYELILVQYIGI